MTEPYIRKLDDTTILDLINHLVIINDKAPNDVTIYELGEELYNITLTKSDISDISYMFTKYKYHYLHCNGINITFNPNWVTFTSENNKVAIRPEMFDKIIKYIENGEQSIMNENNITYDIYNKIIGADNNNQSNNKPIEAAPKPIEAGVKPPINSKSIYDSVMDTLENQVKGATDNETK